MHFLKIDFRYLLVKRDVRSELVSNAKGSSICIVIEEKIPLIDHRGKVKFVKIRQKNFCVLPIGCVNNEQTVILMYNFLATYVAVILYVHQFTGLLRIDSINIAQYTTGRRR